MIKDIGYAHGHLSELVGVLSTAVVAKAERSPESAQFDRSAWN